MQAEAATITVIIATYARPEQLRRAVASLVRQTLPPSEVIVVAYDRDEPTRSTLRELCDPPSAVPVRQLLVPTNTVTVKENAGIADARGDIVCFMDDDAEARVDWLERISRHYARPSVGAVGGRDVVWLDGRPLERAVKDVGVVRWYGRVIGGHHESSEGSRRVHFLKGCNMSYRRGMLALVDVRLAGTVPYGFELDLGLEVGRRGGIVVYDPTALVDHYSTTHYGADRADISWLVNHNQTYILLKHLNWPRRVAFLLYTYFIGDRNAIGLARIPWLAARERWPLAAYRGHFAGKLAGIGTYLGSNVVRG